MAARRSERGRRGIGDSLLSHRTAARMQEAQRPDAEPVRAALGVREDISQRSSPSAESLAEGAAGAASPGGGPTYAMGLQAPEGARGPRGTLGMLRRATGSPNSQHCKHTVAW